MGTKEKFWLTFVFQFVIEALRVLIEELKGDDKDKPDDKQ